jgi:hypothetical protein
MLKLGTLLVLVIACLTVFAAADEAALSLAEYKSRLDQYSAEIQKVVEHPEHAVDFYRDVPPSFQVQTQAGVIAVSMEFMHKEMEKYLKAAPNFKTTIISQLADRIKAMRAEADSFESARDGDPRRATGSIRFSLRTNSAGCVGRPYGTSFWNAPMPGSMKN